MSISEKEYDRILQLLAYERSLWDRGVQFIAGIDEAGRGPLAGPVVAAAVIFNADVRISGINDSKKLTSGQRERLYHAIRQEAVEVATGIVHEREIDRINILQATYKAMRMAVGSLSIRPGHLLIDGGPLPEKFYPQTPIVQGDRKCYSVAAASIIAKVTRDRMMIEYDEMFPQYGFAKHKGYGTKAHFDALRIHGPCAIHRKSFHLRGWGCQMP
jgi:ribonuclease HII